MCESSSNIFVFFKQFENGFQCNEQTAPEASQPEPYFFLVGDWRAGTASPVETRIAASGTGRYIGRGTQKTQQAASLWERLQGALFALELGHLGALWQPEPDFMPIFEGYLTGNRIKSA